MPERQDPKRLLQQYFWEHRWTYGASLLSIIISEFITVQFPNVLGQFTNALQAHRLKATDIPHYVLLLLVIAAGYVVFYGFGQYRNGQMGRRFEYELRRRLYDHWQLLSTGYFRRRSIGDLLNHALNDVQNVRELMSMGLNIMTNATFLLCATLIMTFRTVGIKLTLISIIPILFVPAFVIWIGPRVRGASRSVQEGLSDMAELTEESLSAIRLIKGTANEDVEAKRFEARVDAIVARQMSLIRISSLFQTVFPFAESLSFSIGLLYGGYLAIHHEIKLGSFVAFTFYVTMLFTPLQQIGQFVNSFQRAQASITRLSNLLSEAPDITDPPEPAPVTR
ncbi:MAG: ABC transporter ATP-binding protein, partial [Alicyclobacillus sp.]|nr:ABC transporter ATP-binding protein [Alicyclobacillus sp.]